MDSTARENDAYGEEFGTEILFICLIQRKIASTICGRRKVLSLEGAVRSPRGSMNQLT